MLCIECIEFMILLYTFLVISSARYKEYMICLISFITFSDVLLAFTCAGAIGKLWRICLKVNILSLLPFCWLLKLRSFSAIPIILFGFTFGFSGTSFLIAAFLNSLIEKVAWFPIWLLLTWLAISKPFAKDDGYPKYFVNISLFMFSSSFLISLTKFSFNLLGDFSALSILRPAFACLGV